MVEWTERIFSQSLRPALGAPALRYVAIVARRQTPPFGHEPNRRHYAPPWGVRARGEQHSQALWRVLHNRRHTARDVRRRVTGSMEQEHQVSKGWRYIWVVNNYCDLIMDLQQDCSISVMKRLNTGDMGNLKALSRTTSGMILQDLTSSRRWLWRMTSSEMLRRVAVVRTDVSEEPIASIIRVTRIDELGTMLGSVVSSSAILVTLMMEAIRCNIPEDGIL
jgi:hypothetical protein